MAVRPGAALGKLLYGALFTAVLPLALAGWSVGAAPNVSLPVPAWPTVGWALAGAGAILWAAGALALYTRGGGLPMNAFPPPRLVSSGVYALVGHPLYVGATLAAAGASVATGSAAGLWLVTPVLGLGAAALWWGHERADLRARLGPPPRAPALGVPFATGERPRALQRVGALVVLLASGGLTAASLCAAGLGGAPCWFATAAARTGGGGLAFPVPIVVIVLAALLARTSRELRDLVLTGLAGCAVLAALVLALPGGPFGGHLPVAADGAVLSLLAMGAAHGLAGRRGSLPGWARGLLALSAGALLAGGAIPAAPGTVPALLLGGAAFVVGAARGPLWRAFLRGCERVANCWRERDLGAVRVLSAGWFAALPAAGSAALAVVLLGPGSGWAIGAAFGAILAGSALWAQTIEGSPALSRPYGFFGSLLGAHLFALAAAWLGFDTPGWLLAGSWAVVAPWAQGAARLRCLANGCCHGAPCARELGIVYRHPRTRVVRLAHLEGVPIHPSQLHSMVANAAGGVVTLRLWAEGAPLALVAGAYFILLGLGRFVEEAYRGEPQTPVYAGLRLYQWISIGCVVLGAGITTLPGTPRAPLPAPSLDAVWAGLAIGAGVWFATSVDFPRSSRRFARLA